MAGAVGKLKSRIKTRRFSCFIFDSGLQALDSDFYFERSGLRKVTRLGLPNCYLVSNGTVEIVVAGDIGPRVLGYCFVGGRNVLGECPEVSVETEWGEWRP